MAKVIKKTSKSRQKKTIDVSNVDAVMEEVKKLALQKQVDDINVKEDKIDAKDEKDEGVLAKSVEEEKDTQEQIDDINSELHDMALFHSNNQYKWDNLKKKRTDLIKERKELSSKLCDINIKNKKEKRIKWYDIRDNICTAFEKNNIPFHKKKK